MPVLALEASQLILLAVTAAVGALAFWLVGHTVEKDIHALGDVVPSIGEGVKTILSPGVVVAVVAIAYLVTRKR